MKVLVGVDGSVSSFAAVELAGRMLSAANDEMVFYYGPPHVSVAGRERSDKGIIKRAQQALATAVFDEAKGRVAEPMRGRVETVVGSGKPAHELLDVAADQNVDMIVIGARGVGPIERLLLGSVSRAIVHHSTLPVLVSRPPDEEVTRESLYVMLACDGSDASKHAAELLHSFTWPQGALGRVVTVVESIFAGHLPEWLEKEALESDTEPLSKALIKETEADRERVQAEMSEYCTELPEMFLDHSPIVVEGHASEKILATISAEKPDLVVVGARGLAPLSRLLLGSTSEALLSHSPCSVLVVPKCHS